MGVSTHTSYAERSTAMVLKCVSAPADMVFPGRMLCLRSYFSVSIFNMIIPLSQPRRLASHCRRHGGCSIEWLQPDTDSRYQPIYGGQTPTEISRALNFTSRSKSAGENRTTRRRMRPRMRGRELQHYSQGGQEALPSTGRDRSSPWVPSLLQDVSPRICERIS